MKQYILLILLLVATTTQGCKNENTERKNDEINNLMGAVGSKPSGKFLIMSDIHFNPYCDSKILPQLVKADYTDWPEIFKGATDTSYGYYDSDTYYRLLVSGLEAMQAQNNNPDMIVINGDFLSHHFGSNYYSRTGITQRDSMESFVRNTISFVFMMIDEYFPGVPVLPVLGNNDDYCGDYNIEPNGPFLSFFVGKCKPMLRNMRETGFVSTFSKGGYYKSNHAMG